MRKKLASPLCPIDPGHDLPGFLVWHRSTFGAATMTNPTPPAPEPPAPAPTPPTPTPTPPPADPDKGFPENTPVAEMTNAQAAAYWKSQSRKHENTAKARGDYDDLKKQAAEAAKLRKERETENEKAVRESAEKATAEERQKNAPRLVSAEFRAAAKGVLSTEQRDALLEDLDLTKYLTDKGEVDVAKVEKKVAAFAPKADDGKGKRNFPDLGQGKRDSKPAAGVASGREMYEARRGAKKAS